MSKALPSQLRRARNKPRMERRLPILLLNPEQSFRQNSARRGTPLRAFSICWTFRCRARVSVGRREILEPSVGYFHAFIEIPHADPLVLSVGPVVVHFEKNTRNAIGGNSCNAQKAAVSRARGHCGNDGQARPEAFDSF